MASDTKEDAIRKLGPAIRNRLRLAADGQWQKLVDECHADLAALAQRGNLCVHAVAPSSEPEDISDATLQAAAVKSRNGSDKGACQILTGGPPMPPGPETDAKVQALCRAEPLDSAGSDALGRALDRASAIRRRT